MGFGFNLIVVFILIPLTAILLFVWVVTKENIFGKTIGLIWLGLIGLAIGLIVLEKMTSKMLLKKKDFYGHYIIDRTFFPGKQAEWQYRHFRFDIKNNDSIYFYVTDNKIISTTFKGSITTTKPYSSERLFIKMDKRTHHILTSNPTIYRNARSFYLVFNSPNFGNVFFKKE